MYRFRHPDLVLTQGKRPRDLNPQTANAIHFSSPETIGVPN
jgi:hypothetical protein